MTDGIKRDGPWMVRITYRFEYDRIIEEILDDLEITDYVRYPRVHSRDRDGKNYNSKSHPGHGTVVEAMVTESNILESLIDQLDEFKQARSSHEHLRVMVFSADQYL